MITRFAFALALIGAASGSWTKAGSAAEPLTLSIGTSRDPNNGALLIVAKGMNYFKDNGLDVTLKYFPSAGDLVTAMAAGSLTIGAGGSVPTTTLRAGGYPAVVLAQQADISGAQQIVVQKEIAAPKDLEGKKVGANFGTVSQMLADAMLEKFRIPSDKVMLVNLDAADMVTALLRGDIAGAALWEPWASQAVKGGAHRLVTGTTSYVPGQSGAIDLLGDHGLLIAQQAWVEKNPAIVKAVLKSLIEAQKFIAGNPDKAADVVGNELQIPGADMKGLMSRNKYSLAIDSKLIRDMNAESEFLQKSGKLKSPVKAADWVYPAPLKQLAPNLVPWKP